MKAKTFTAMMAALLFCAVTSAESYSIRVTFNTNLRVAGSLQARIVETAPAGTILNVVGSADRWLRIDRNGNEVWMAIGSATCRVESSDPTPSQTASNIDNCCFVDRQCQSDAEWTDGYYAYQNNQCNCAATISRPNFAAARDTRFISNQQLLLRQPAVQ